jgi:hypothetical protein
MPKYKPVKKPKFDSESRPGPLPLKKVKHGPLPKSKGSPIGRFMRQRIQERRKKPQGVPHPVHRKPFWHA